MSIWDAGAGSTRASHIASYAQTDGALLSEDPARNRAALATHGRLANGLSLDMLAHSHKQAGLTQTFKSAFAPIVDDNTRVLILGSLPGERSLAAQEYYAHSTNAFWWLIERVLSEDGLAGRPYAERLHSLRDHCVGLWDVIAQGERRGSLDAAIRHATERNLAGFAAGLPALRAIVFNGGEAARRGRRQLADHAARWTLIDLPSSSAAYAALPRTAKLAAWSKIGDFLR